MAITSRNIIRHEFIGLNVQACEANIQGICFRGKVVDETKNMITIKLGNMTKKIPKKGSTFMFFLPDGKRVKVDGSRISARPEERIKLKVKKW